VRVVRSGGTAATVTGTATWTPGWAPLMWRSPSCVRAASSPRWLLQRRPGRGGPDNTVVATVHVRRGRRVDDDGPRERTGGQDRRHDRHGVNADGYREVLGIHTATKESGAGWLAFFRDLSARGLTGVALVTSDAHRGRSRRWGRRCRARAGKAAALVLASTSSESRHPIDSLPDGAYPSIREK